MSPVPIFPQHNAEVAQHGQRRRTEAPIPQGFVGSNPTLRTNNTFRKINRLESVRNTVMNMPVVQVTVWSGISLDNKKKMVVGITKVLEDIGIPSQATTIIISEEPKENWASAGKLHSETFQK